MRGAANEKRNAQKKRNVPAEGEKEAESLGMSRQQKEEGGEKKTNKQVGEGCRYRNKKVPRGKKREEMERRRKP